MSVVGHKKSLVSQEKIYVTSYSHCRAMMEAVNVCPPQSQPEVSELQASPGSEQLGI